MPSVYVNANVSTAGLSATARRAAARRAGQKCCGTPDPKPVSIKPSCAGCKPPYIFR